MSDLWTQHSSLIKHLYQVERKRLKDVKDILEGQYGFPHHPISVYEIKLRDVLKLRKKLKREDWRRIYLYARSRCYEKKQYDIYLNGTLIPWDKAWKEIRRSGALQSEAFLSQDLELPLDVTVLPRSRKTDTSNSSSSPISDDSVALLPSSPPQSQSSNSQAPLQSTCATSVAFTSKICQDEGRCRNQNALHVARVELIHEALPWNLFRQILLTHFNDGQVITCEREINSIAFTYMPNDGFFSDMHGMALAPVSDTIYPSLWAASPRYLSSATSSVEFWYQHLCMMTYLLSNRLHEWYDGVQLFGQLGEVLEHLPATVITKTFQSHSISVRALWDSFVYNVLRRYLLRLESMDMLRPSIGAISNVISVVSSMHPEWIRGSKDKLLLLAASLGNADLVRRLLHQNACTSSDSEHGWTTIIGATAAGSTECVKLLVRHCDINKRRAQALCYSVSWILRMHRGRSTRLPIYTKTSQFIAFLHHFFKPPGKCCKTPNFEWTLRVLISSGANVDATYPLDLCGFEEAYTKSKIRYEWHVTCLEMTFYLCKRTFLWMQQYSGRNPNYLSRAGVCQAIESGVVALNEYLASRRAYSPAYKERFLQLVLLEQFFVPRHPRGANLNDEGAKIARSLFERGSKVRCSLNPATDISSTLLQVWIASVDEYGLSEDLEAILHHLGQARLTPGPDIFGDCVEDCVEERGTKILQMLLGSRIFSREAVGSMGAAALVRASKFNNYEAVSWLLDMGVGVNSELVNFSDEKSTILSHCLGIGGEKASLDMCRHLIEHGALLRYQVADQNCFELIRSAMLMGKRGCLDVIQFFLAFQDELSRITVANWNALLRSILRLKCSGESSRLAFEYLFDNYFELAHGPILSLAIHASLPPAFIQSLLRLGADVNEDDEILGPPLGIAIKSHQFGLARQLVSLGADINAPSKIERGGALCTACDLNVLSPIEKREKMRFIRFLIDSGAIIDGNDEISRLPSSFSPLQLCAKAGDLETASILLQHGANPNIVRGSWDMWNPSNPGMIVYSSGLSDMYTALDLAASLGRVDMTQLLLKAGALSQKPGLSGYDGAMERSSSRGYSAVTELIRQHLHLTKAWLRGNFSLKLQHQTMIDEINKATGGLLQHAIEGLRAQNEYQRETEGQAS